MSRLSLISLLYIILLSQSVLAQKMESNSSLVYDAQLSAYKYDFEVSYFPVNSQRQTLQMAYIYLEGKPDKPVVTLMHGKNFNAHYWTRRVICRKKAMGYSFLTK